MGQTNQAAGSARGIVTPVIPMTGRVDSDGLARPGSHSVSVLAKPFDRADAAATAGRPARIEN
jgi:hypothetical protein